MDDGDVELSDHILIPNSDSSSNNIQASLSSNSFVDDLLRNAQTCTHTHTCNPPGPDATHTHTCYHTHTHVIPSDEDNGLHNKKDPVSKPSGNREAVRKYREKKKAHAAYLEEEVKKLRHVNKVLMGKLQRRAILETEIVRLRGLLLDLRGKIDNELGDFLFNLDGSFDPSNGIGGCGEAINTWESNCQHAIVECETNEKYIESSEKGLQDSLETLVSSSPR
ncbi:hypothetical protein DH2020_045430 [Rehmannia glutinosa]|uniref:BZIP domain-containing protein n=1 Tax=Rehmannia glutinosa TaxID=99300 RepID=A0ABR0UF31_REHGL